MSNEITFNAKLSKAPRTQGDFTYKITPHGDFDWRHRLGLVPGNRGYRGGLTRDRVLALSLDHKVQDHVPGRKRILARSSLGRQKCVPFRSTGNRRAAGPAKSYGTGVKRSH